MHSRNVRRDQSLGRYPVSRMAKSSSSSARKVLTNLFFPKRFAKGFPTIQSVIGQKNRTPNERLKGAIIKKNKNTFAKIQREREKKRKADEKRRRKLERKAAGTNTTADQSDSNNQQDHDVDSENGVEASNQNQV